MKKNFLFAVLFGCLFLSLTAWKLKSKPLNCNTFTISLQSDCGNELVVVIDDLSTPSTGDVHLYDSNNNYLGDPIVDIVTGGNQGGLDIEFHLVDDEGPDYHGSMYDVTCGGYSSAFSYGNCQ